GAAASTHPGRRAGTRPWHPDRPGDRRADRAAPRGGLHRRGHDARGRPRPRAPPAREFGGVVIVDCAVYEDGRRRAGGVELDDAYDACRAETGAWVWIGLYEPGEDEFDSVRREFELHELAVEDAVKAHQRPKLEEYGDSLFVVLKTARYHEDEEVVEFGEILLFIGRGFIVSVRHGQAAELHGVRREVEH